MSNVSYLIENYGAWDYQIGVTLFDAAKLPSLIDKLNDDFHGEISRIAAIPAFEVHKWRLKL